MTCNTQVRSGQAPIVVAMQSFTRAAASGAFGAMAVRGGPPALDWGGSGRPEGIGWGMGTDEEGLIGKPPVRRRVVALVWEQFGPYHMDRCNALAAALGENAHVIGVEVASRSYTYAWEKSEKPKGKWTKRTLFPGKPAEIVPWYHRVFKSLVTLRGADFIFLAGYHLTENFVLSFIFRLCGRRVFLMSESKFDDMPRSLPRELLKQILCLPYLGAMVGGWRHREYFRFLGFRRRPIVEGYDAVDLDRVRGLGNHPPAPGGASFEDRPFVFVGRFVEKKNIEGLLEAYARYREIVGDKARRLILVGGGELQEQIVKQIRLYGLEDFVDLPGFLQAERVAQTVAGGLALALPSVVEQWGLVVNEALAFNLPILASECCGARDTLVRHWVNGFITEPGNAEGLAWAMVALSEDKALWLRMVSASSALAEKADTSAFVSAAGTLLSKYAPSLAERLVHPHSIKG